MADFKRLVAVISAVSMTLSLFGISAVGAAGAEELLQEDYNSDGIIGPTDYKIFISALHGLKTGANPCNISGNVANAAILKRIVLESTSEKRRDAASIPTLFVDDSIMIESYNLPEDKRGDWEYVQSLLPDGVYETREQFESEVLQYINLDEGNNNFRERLDEKFDEKFFEDNSVIMVRKGRSNSFENLSLVDGTLTVESFYLNVLDGIIMPPLAYDYIGMAVAVSKDVLAQYDYSAVTSVDNTKKSEAGDVSANTFRTVAFPQTYEKLVTIDNTSGLSDYLSAMENGVFENPDSLAKIKGAYDEAFFEKNKLVAYYIDYPMDASDDGLYSAYYDEKNMVLSLSLSGVTSMTEEIYGTLVLASVSRNICFDRQEVKVHIWDAGKDY